MKYYACYGLKVESGLDLPELAPASSGSPDVRFDISYEPVRQLPVGEDGRALEIGDTVAYLYWERIGGFTVRQGNSIVIQPVPGADARLLRAALLGLVLGVLLFQRRYVVLHGSAVVVNGRAVAVIGHKRWGKSTLVAALHARGHALLCDDVTAVAIAGHRVPVVQSGLPQLKVWPEVVSEVLAADPERVPRLFGNTEKRAWRVGDAAFASSAAPLGAIYVLDIASEVAVERLSAIDAFLHLLQYAHVIPHVTDQRIIAPFLDQFRRLAEAVPVVRLQRPAGFAHLAGTVDAMETDLELRLA